MGAADRCPGLHPLINVPEGILYTSQKSQPNGALLPTAATLITQLYIGSSFVPISLSLYPCSYFCIYSPNKLPSPKSLSWALLLEGNKLRQHQLSKCIFSKHSHVTESSTASFLESKTQAAKAGYCLAPWSRDRREWEGSASDEAPSQLPGVCESLQMPSQVSWEGS